MSDDLVKQLRTSICATLDADLMDEAADRIEELEAKLAAAVEAMNQARLAFAGFVSASSAIDMLDKTLAEQNKSET